MSVKERIILDTEDVSSFRWVDISEIETLPLTPIATFLTKWRKKTMIKLIVFDLDGTLFLGERLRDGTLDLLNHLKNININFVFYTNTSSKSTERVLKKLQQYGINTTEDSIYTNQCLIKKFHRHKSRIDCICKFFI